MIATESTPDPTTIHCGHPDCTETLVVEGNDIVRTRAWGNDMGRGCAVEEVRDRCGWVMDGWRYFCPTHDDWGQLI
jgi:hypothetical protein